MKFIIGLGNPTAQYAGTRHNIGFDAVTRLADDHRISVTEKKHKALCGKGIIGGEKVILLKPQTYMNLSGESVRDVLDFYKAGPEDIIVCYDDVSLAPGQLRVREKGSAGGHNGIKSIIKNLSTKEFARLKVGIGPQPNIPSEAFVLQKFPETDLKQLKTVLDKSVESIEYYFKNGIAKTQNLYN